MKEGVNSPANRVVIICLAILLGIFILVSLIFWKVHSTISSATTQAAEQTSYSQALSLPSTTHDNIKPLGSSMTSTHPSVTAPKPPISTGCSTYRPCPTTDPPEEQIYQRTPPQETGTGCTSTTVCQGSDEDTCSVQDNCGADSANNDDQPQCTIRDNCGAQQAPDSL